MRFYKLTFVGPETSKTILGVHLCKNVSQILAENELPLTVKRLNKECVTTELIESEIRPEITLSEIKGGNGIVWRGATKSKPTDYGTFTKDVPVYGLNTPVTEFLLQKPGFEKIG